MTENAWMSRALPMALAIFVVITAAGSTSAASRPDARTMTCSEVDKLVRKSGKIVMTLSDTRFKQIVSSRNYCLPGQVTRTLRIKTKDQDRCWAGYECVERENQYDN